MSNIKGQLLEPITVLQLGGIQDEDILTLMEGDSLLGLGGTYLLLTREHPDDPMIHHLIAPGYDHLSASTPAQVDELATRFTAAYAEEIDPIELIWSAASSTQAAAPSTRGSSLPRLR